MVRLLVGRAQLPGPTQKGVKRAGVASRLNQLIALLVGARERGEVAMKAGAKQVSRAGARLNGQARIGPTLLEIGDVALQHAQQLTSYRQVGIARSHSQTVVRGIHDEQIVGGAATGKRELTPQQQ